MIGELIRVFRQERDVGVLELAGKLNINRISLFRIEKGERQPSEQTAIAAFKALGLSEEHIYAIFVFNEMVRVGALAKDAGRASAKQFIDRLNKKDKDSTLLQGHFKRIMHRKAL